MSLGCFCSSCHGGSCSSCCLGLLDPSLPHIFDCLVDGFSKSIIRFEVLAEQVALKALLLLWRAQLELYCSLQGLLIYGWGVVLALLIDRISLSVTSSCWSILGFVFTRSFFLISLAVSFFDIFSNVHVVWVLTVIVASLSILELLLSLLLLEDVVDLVREHQIQSGHNNLLRIIKNPFI